MPVVPDRGGQGEDALQDAYGHAVGGPPAVGFEVELAFEGLIDRLDALADRAQQRPAAAADPAARPMARQAAMPVSRVRAKRQKAVNRIRRAYGAGQIRQGRARRPLPP